MHSLRNVSVLAWELLVTCASDNKLCDSLFNILEAAEGEGVMRIKINKKTWE
jgi:hypothetical protein